MLSRPCFCQDSCKNGPSNDHRGGEPPRKICRQSIATKLNSLGLDSWHRPVTPGENVGDPYSGGKKRPPAPNSGGLGKVWKSVVYDGFIFKSLNISIHNIYIYIFPHFSHLGHLQFLTFAVFGAAQVRTCFGPRSRTDSTAGNLTTGRSVRSVRRSWPRWKI